MFLVLTGAITRAPLDRPRVAAALPRRASNRRTRPPAAYAESARSGGPLGQSSLSQASLPRAAPITALAPSSSRTLACWPFPHLVVQQALLHPRRPRPGSETAGMRTRHPRPAATRSAFAGFRFPPDVIVLAVRWYLRFGLSYRDVQELLAERGNRGRPRHNLPLGAAVHAAAGRRRSAVSACRR
jgi:hypothetical protein